MDTIAAVSTSLSGEGGIGIVRISGAGAFAAAGRIFKPARGGKIDGYASFSSHYGWVIDSRGKRVDEALLTVMRAPRTYTREDVAEISCHGGPAVINKILKLCVENGARLAEPGEFTRRAFLNGRIDLLQAEAVLNLIRSKTEHAAEISAGQLKGTLSGCINSIKEDVAGLVARLEATIDFPDQDIRSVPSAGLRREIQKISGRISSLISDSARNKIYTSGAAAAIIGRPNVGKSSLLNRLLLEERSIVTPIAGTTRDIVSETLSLRGIPLKIMDTAGLGHGRHGKNTIEALADEKSRSALKKADLILFVCDISSAVTSADRAIARSIEKQGVKTVLVLNKSDLAGKKNAGPFTGMFRRKIPHCVVSVLKNTGISRLEDILFRQLTGGRGGIPDVSETPVITGMRQESLLSACVKDLDAALSSIEKKEPPEFTSQCLKQALGKLGEMTGEVTSADILDRIFENFCIGK